MSNSFFIYLTSGLLTLTVLGILSLVGIIAVNPIYFCLPVLLADVVPLSGMVYRYFYAQKKGKSVTEVYIEKLKEKD